MIYLSFGLKFANFF